jgi:hypothetical protein
MQVSAAGVAAGAAKAVVVSAPAKANGRMAAQRVGRKDGKIVCVSLGMSVPIWLSGPTFPHECRSDSSVAPPICWENPVAMSRKFDDAGHDLAHFATRSAWASELSRS